MNTKDPQNRGEPPKTYSFDSVYAPDAKQLDIYNETARPIVDFVLEGYNGMLCVKNGINPISYLLSV